MDEAEKFLWEEIAQLPEHKRAFDTDVFNAIITAMKRYAAEKCDELKQDIAVIQSTINYSKSSHRLSVRPKPAFRFAQSALLNPELFQSTFLIAR